MLDNFQKEALKQALEKIDRNEAKMKGSSDLRPGLYLLARYSKGSIMVVAKERR